MLTSLILLLYTAWIGQPVPIQVEGSPVFVARAQEALAQLDDVDLWRLSTGTDRIFETPNAEGSYFWERAMGFHPTGWPDCGSVCFAGIIVHESQHNWDYTMCASVGGVESERRALSSQADFYGRKQDAYLRDYSLGLIGSYGIGFTQRYYDLRCAQHYDVDAGKWIE